LPVSFFLTFTVSGLLDLLNDGPIYKSQNVSNESCRAGRTGATQQEQDEQARHSRTQFRGQADFRAGARRRRRSSDAAGRSFAQFQDQV
ncbi:MAG: hypothetical protein E6260_23235, partial [Enterobacter roggenkampii]|nr:hypothetical protein [Enterobacter roggenkampii]